MADRITMLTTPPSGGVMDYVHTMTERLGADARVLVFDKQRSADLPIDGDCVLLHYSGYGFARKALVEAGKVSCVQQVINTEKQVINFEVRDKGFGDRPPGGGSTDHVFEAKSLDGKNIAGRSRTTSPQKSFDDVPYAYDISFSAAIEAKK